MNPRPVVASEVYLGLEVVSIVASRLDPEDGAVVILVLATEGTPVGVPPFIPVAETNTVTSPDIVDQHPSIVVGNFLLSSRRALNILFRSGARELLTKNAGFWDLHAAKISCTKSRRHNLNIMLGLSGPLVIFPRR